MELPRPRPFGTEGTERTLDFISLHGHSSFQHQQDPRAQRAYLETQDFLRPLEQVEKKSTGKGENKTIKTATATTTVDKLPPLFSSSPSSSSVEHILPGGIGTYSISHISNFSQRVPKTEVQVPAGTAAADRASSAERNFEANNNRDDSSRNNLGDIGEGVFTLWDESAVVKKGSGATVMKDTTGERQVLRDAAEQRTLQAPFAHRSSFSSLSNSKQSTPKNKSFTEMMKSCGRGLHDDEDDDAGEEFTSEKPVSSHQEGKNAEQRANTPRSKHSATEQRRRSKINDRFQILRDLIPQNDQKRDKASFLLEVIEHIQFLQEKVHRYESSYQGWNQEPAKLTPWRNGHGPGESMVDHSRAIKSCPGPALMFAGKFDDSKIAAGPTILANTHNSVEPDLSTSAAYKPLDCHTGLANEAVPVQSNSFTSVGRSDGHAHTLQRPDAENVASQHQCQLWQSRHCVTEFPVTGDVLNEQELTVEGGTISISGVYSQGLLNNLTQALQSLGVDLSQASISVQVDLGKRANGRLTSTTSGAKDHEEPSNNRTMMHYITENSGEESDQSHQKRRKTE